MKKIIIALFLLIGVILAGCVTTGPKTYEEAEELSYSMVDVKLGEIAGDISKRFPGEAMALWVITGGEYNASLSDYFEPKMAQGGLLIATRTRMSLINKEFEFQFSGMVNDNDILSYGKMMGVSKIILIEVKYYDFGYECDITVMDVERGIMLYSANIAQNLFLANIMKQYRIAYPVRNPEHDISGTGERTWTVLTRLSQPEYDQAHICRTFSSNLIQYLQSFKYFYMYATLFNEKDSQNYSWETLVQNSKDELFIVSLYLPNGYYQLYFSNNPDTYFSEKGDFTEIGDFSRGSGRRSQICKFINDNIDQVFVKMEEALNRNNDRFSQRSKDAIKLAHIQ
jgi:hypothetical protein